MTLQTKLFIALGIFLVGLSLGLYTGHVWHKAELAAQLREQVKAANTAADKRVQDERASVGKTEADLAEQQGLSVKLNQALSKARADNLVLQEQIDALTFHPTPRPLPANAAGQPAMRCPGHPVSSPEFVQFYNAAAQGSATGATSGYPGGG